MIASPFQAIRSFSATRCGLVYVPTERPWAASNAAHSRVVEVLPLVPVTWMIGKERSGSPIARRRAAIRSSVGWAARPAVPRSIASRLT